jgi:hypothetical protein
MVQFPARKTDFHFLSFPKCPNKYWDLPASYAKGTDGSFSRGKVARA